MNLKKLETQLIRHEDLKLKPYTDTVGKITIGVGHNLTDKGITKAQALSLLSDDISETLTFLRFRFPWFRKLLIESSSADDVRARAIADLTFNVMGGILGFKKMLAAIEVDDWKTAADELLDSKFAKQVGQRAFDLAYMLRTGKNPK